MRKVSFQATRSVSGPAFSSCQLASFQAPAVQIHARVSMRSIVIGAAPAARTSFAELLAVKMAVAPKNRVFVSSKVRSEILGYSCFSRMRMVPTVLSEL